MGRKRQSAEPIPVEYVRECFIIRDGVLIWRERPSSHFPARPDDSARTNRKHAGSPAGFRGPGGKPLVRFVYGGRTRRVALLRAAWIVATGELPKGAVKPRDANEWNCQPSNLIVLKFGREPAQRGRRKPCAAPSERRCDPEGAGRIRTAG